MAFTYTNMLAQLNVASAHPGGLSATKNAWEKLKNYPHDVILDAGCGTGKTLDYLTEVTNSCLIGIDKHKVMIKKAKQRLKDKSVELKLADIEKLPFANESVDCVISESVISFNQIEQALREFNRILRPGGVLYLIEITADPSLTTETVNEINQFYGTKSILAKNQWLHLIDQADFNVIEYSPLPANNEGQTDLKIDADLNPIYLDYLIYHYHLIESIQTKLIGYQFFCQKKTIKED